MRLSRLMMRRDRDNRGAAAVEFALVLIPLMTLILGMLQYGLYFWSLQSGAHAAREAARQAAVGVLSCGQLDAAAAANARGVSSGLNATRAYYTDATLSAAAPTPVVAGNVVKVTVTFNAIDMGFPVPFINGGLVHEEAVARVESTSTANSIACS